MKKMNKKGFTLIEMLAVIAIIAVLVAIVIPVVGNATEKAKEAADAANIRAAIAEVTTAGLANEGETSKTVDLKQSDNFDTNTDLTDIGGFPLAAFNNKESVTIAFANNAVTVDGQTAKQWAGDDEEEPCTTFVDADEDGKCDTCGEAH